MRNFKGTRDYYGFDMQLRQHLIQTISQIFENYGLAAMTTPAIEYQNTLLAKYGPEAEKLIYKLDYQNDTTDSAALRYDLTVPLSCFIAQHGGEIRSI